MNAAAMQARADFHNYGRYLATNNLHGCVSIERRHGMFGYPPELVSVGLSALAEGRDADEAIHEHLEFAL